MIRGHSALVYEDPYSQDTRVYRNGVTGPADPLVVGRLGQTAEIIGAVAAVGMSALQLWMLYDQQHRAKIEAQHEAARAAAAAAARAAADKKRADLAAAGMLPEGGAAGVPPPATGGVTPATKQNLLVGGAVVAGALLLGVLAMGRRRGRRAA